jgi:hypothetical protein
LDSLTPFKASKSDGYFANQCGYSKYDGSFEVEVVEKASWISTSSTEVSLSSGNKEFNTLSVANSQFATHTHQETTIAITWASTNDMPISLGTTHFEPSHSQNKAAKKANICDSSFDESTVLANKYSELQTRPMDPMIAQPRAHIPRQLDRNVPAAGFQVFQNLPIQIRHKIFNLSCSSPRVVELQYSQQIAHAISRTPAPVSLHICRESRLEAQKKLKLLFNEHWLIPRIWIDPEVDTLYLTRENRDIHSSTGHSYCHFSQDLYLKGYPKFFHILFKSLQPNIWSNLKRVAINEQTYCSYARNLSPNNRPYWIKGLDIDVLTQFKKLEVIGIIQDPYTISKHNGLVSLIDSSSHYCEECKGLGNKSIGGTQNKCQPCFRRVGLLKRIAVDWETRPVRNDLLKKNLQKLLRHHPEWAPRLKYMIATRRDLKRIGLGY